MSKDLQELPVIEQTDAQDQKTQVEFLAAQSAVDRLGEEKIKQLGGQEGIARLFGYYDGALEHSADA